MGNYEERGRMLCKLSVEMLMEQLQQCLAEFLEMLEQWWSFAMLLFCIINFCFVSFQAREEMSRERLRYLEAMVRLLDAIYFFNVRLVDAILANPRRVWTFFPIERSFHFLILKEKII